MALNKEALLSYFEDFYIKYLDQLFNEERYKWSILTDFPKSVSTLYSSVSNEEIKNNLEDLLHSLSNMLNGTYALTNFKLFAKQDPETTGVILMDLLEMGRSKDMDIIRTSFDVFESSMNNLVVQYKGIPKNKFNREGFTGYRTAALFLYLMYPETKYFYKDEEYNYIKKLIRYKGINSSPIFNKYVDCCQMSEEILDLLKKDVLFADIKKRLLEQYRYYNNDYGYNLSEDAWWHLIIQDLLWSTRYYKRYLQGSWTPQQVDNEYDVDYVMNPVALKPTEPNKKGSRDIDYDSINGKKSALGKAGEAFVMRYERDKIRRLFPDGSIPEPVHTSLTEPHAGYDITSHNEKGEPIYIEVKTTSGSYKNTFYVTQNELSASKKYKDHYLIYRVCDFKKDKGKIRITPGPFDDNSFQPVLYEVKWSF